MRYQRIRVEGSEMNLRLADHEEISKMTSRIAKWELPRPKEAIAGGKIQ